MTTRAWTGLIKGVTAGLILAVTGNLAAQPEQVKMAAAICPGDVLSVKVFDHPNLSTQVRVQYDGRIRLPLCGWVAAAGQTPGELSEALSEGYAQEDIEHAFVTVQIAQYGPRMVYVLGEVLEGGTSLEITPPATLTLTQAVSAAGGFKDSADLRQVIVRRTDTEGRTKELKVDVLAVISGAKGARDPVLHIGDTVIIPRSKPVYVTGEVGKPGMQYVGATSTPRCSEVLGKAGGLTEAANRSRVLVFRRSKQTQNTRLLEVNMDEFFSGAFSQDIRILPGDMVMVARQRKIYVLGEVDKPGALDPEPGVDLTAFQAITLAGGFTEYGSQNDVLLVREGEMSTLDLRKPYRKGENIADPELRPGDIVFVRESMW